jgi:signal transduction histidine kinase
MAYASVDHREIISCFPLPVAILRVANGAPVVFDDLNRAFLEVFDLMPGAVVGRGVDAAFLTEAALSIEGGARRVGAEDLRLKIAVRCRGHVTRHAFVFKRISEDAGGRFVLLVVEPAPQLSSNERRHAASLDQLAPLSSSFVYVYDLARARTRYVNSALADLLGVTDAIDLSKVLTRLDPEHVERLIGYVDDFGRLEDGEVSILRFRLLDNHERWRWIEAHTRVFSRNRKGAVLRVIGVAADVTEQQALAVALQSTARALHDAEDRERRRIARELHDSTAQHLVSIGLNLSNLEQRVVFEDDQKALVRGMRLALASAHREIRTFSYLLHPPKLEERGLEATLRAFVDGFGRRTGLDTDFIVDRGSHDVSPPGALSLFRVAQEALMNVHKHAGAKSVRIRLCNTASETLLEVADDGCGLTPEQANRLFGQGAGGVGIAGMKARMEDLGGRVLFLPNAPGLRVRATLPVGFEGMMRQAPPSL